ncbi:MAG: cAMP-activated global transcriptional regulator CRP [Firmicutes bacterium ADurb.Bin153]|nr:MAG: cAMP-activated global transcriptional regulator CRP [Firmicutes bacterium ADurb.Bin153]
MPMQNTSLTLPRLYNEELDRLIEKNSKRYFYPARTIFSVPGDDFNGVFYIKSGRTRHYMANDDGLEKVLYTLTDGWLFGEMAFYLGRKTGLYSQTEADTVLYKISAEKCRALLDESPLFRDAFIRCLAHKILITRFEIENITFNPCKERIIRLLCSAVDKTQPAESGWYELKVKYTHYELGVIVGAARVTVSKILVELMNEGIIRSVNRKIQFNADRYEEYMELFSKF